MDGHTRRDGAVYGGIKPTITTNLGDAENCQFCIIDHFVLTQNVDYTVLVGCNKMGLLVFRGRAFLEMFCKKGASVSEQKSQDT